MNEMKLKILLFLPVLFLILSGCAANKKIKSVQDKVVDVKQSYAVIELGLEDCMALVEEKEKQLFQFRLEIAEKENQIKEKDLKIRELKKKLEGFGSF